MRIYTNPIDAFREVERDLWEMGIDVHPDTMQDKKVTGLDDYLTREVRGYSFKIANWQWKNSEAERAVLLIAPGGAAAQEWTAQVLQYVEAEHKDRTARTPSNPGNSYKLRPQIWGEFIHGEKFAYTYSERLNPQLDKIIHELMIRPASRQAILNIHSYIGAAQDSEDDWFPKRGYNLVLPTADLKNMGGKARIPCSIYYQVMVREKMVDLIYCMRSCDFLTHFPVDILLAIKMQHYFADKLGLGIGTFTYFVGSLHAYRKDMATRGIF